MNTPRDSKKNFFDELHSVYEGGLDEDEDEDGLFKLPFKRHFVPPSDTTRSTLPAARPQTSRTQSAPTSQPSASAKSLQDKVSSSDKSPSARRVKTTGSTSSTPVASLKEKVVNTPLLVEPTTSIGSDNVRPAKRAKTVSSISETGRAVKGKAKEPDPKAASKPEAGPDTKLQLPESLRFIVHDRKAAGKKKPPAPVRKSGLFDGLYFYFVPNNLTGPARKFRIQRASEHGAFCLNSWRADAVTHIVVDRTYNWSQLLSLVNAEIPDNVIIVKENYPGDCMQYRRILDHTQEMYQITGRVSKPGPELVPEPELAEIMNEPPLSLRIKERNRVQETQRFHEVTPPRDMREETPPRRTSQKRKIQNDSDSEDS
ncbi:hypothetical protein BZA05DRAFT_55939 [Tricharina praecox]|uniref:uncharacterized protein n=1 Tax=Tricharina praecox TaxID=43433 RepID=UPI00221E6B32|nr:uncharacterized protein BZA05DRAFT_55939 [Tricharina praecox]KAI5850990.1 hypothetical protein BZA05DRAFT_55939 [Tricharina praecox]